MALIRLDVLLVEKGFYPSREKAKEAIESLRVSVDGKTVSKPALPVQETSKIVALPFEFVSRGGFKLQKALEVFKINLSQCVCLDIGASTGGFTDVCLKNKAKKVYAVDTGSGQLAESIKRDLRVVNLEKTNYLMLEKSTFEDVDFVCMDVSFVSLTKLTPKLEADFADHKDINKPLQIVALIKPQFECGMEYAKKHKGVVKDEKVRQKAIENVVASFEKHGFKNKGLVQSPIKGGDGNIEFLAYFVRK